MTLVRDTRRGRVLSVDGADDGRPFGLVGVGHDCAPHFVAVGTRLRPLPATEGASVGLPEAARATLGVQPGDEVGYVTL